jgi:hypothetical protein
MPCPRCRSIVDARVRRCPHCGVDTDAMLDPARTVIALLIVGAMVVVAVVFHADTYWVALLASMMAGIAFRSWQITRASARRSAPEPSQGPTKPE